MNFLKSVLLASLLLLTLPASKAMAAAPWMHVWKLTDGQFLIKEDTLTSLQKATFYIASFQNGQYQSKMVDDKSVASMTVNQIYVVELPSAASDASDILKFVTVKAELDFNHSADPTAEKVFKKGPEGTAPKFLSETALKAITDENFLQVLQANTHFFRH